MPPSAAVRIPAAAGAPLQPGDEKKKKEKEEEEGRKGSSTVALVIGTALLAEAAGIEPTARSPGAGFSLGVCRSVQTRRLPGFINNFQGTVNQSHWQASRPGA